MNTPERTQIEQAAADLLAALDKMHPPFPMSLEVVEARHDLRMALALRAAAEAELARHAA